MFARTGGGVITWTLDTLTDPYQILGGGEPTTLNDPTDVQYYLAPTFDLPTAANPTGTPTKQTGYEVHYIVADAGNNRIIEVADYFDSSGQSVDAPNTAAGTTKGKHVVVWTTRTQSQQGRRYRFEGVTRHLSTDPTGAYYGYPYIIASVSNARIAGNESTATGDYSGGSLVSINYAPYQTALVVQTTAGTTTNLPPHWLPGTSPVVIAANEPSGNGTVLAAADDLQIRDKNKNLVVRRLARPTYFQQLLLPGTNPSAPTGPEQSAAYGLSGL